MWSFPYIKAKLYLKFEILKSNKQIMTSGWLKNTGSGEMEQIWKFSGHPIMHRE